MLHPLLPSSLTPLLSSSLPLLQLPSPPPPPPPFPFSDFLAPLPPLPFLSSDFLAPLPLLPLPYPLSLPLPPLPFPFSSSDFLAPFPLLPFTASPHPLSSDSAVTQRNLLCCRNGRQQGEVIKVIHIVLVC